MFKVLYKRWPKYYSRDSSGNWFVTTNKSDLKAVVSESEYLFGFHALWDQNSIYEILSMALDILVSISGIDSTFAGDWATKILKIGLNIWAGKAPFDLRSVAEDIVGDLLPDALDSWASSISLMQTLAEVEKVFSDRPQLYLTMLDFSSDYNNEDINYNILFKLGNGQLYSARDLYHLI